MTNAHTPGNWQIRQVAPDSPNLYIMAGASQVACCTNDLYAATFPAQEQEANARLIAAAPELLEQLEKELLYWGAEAKRLYGFEYAHRRRDEISAAIAKAKGK